MFSPSDFNDAVPQFTNGNYASNPLNPLYIEEPGAIDYNRGVEPLQTLPAQWWNWLANQFTAKFNKLNIYVKNIFDELAMLLSLMGITPDATEGTITTGQLKSAFQTNYPEYASTTPPILKTENETLSSGVNGRYNVDQTIIKYATTINLTLYGIQTVDGVTPTDGDYILVKNQTDATENGIYEYTSLGAWTRLNTFPTPVDFLEKIFRVKDGTDNKGKMYYLSNAVFEDGTVFGSDDILFTEYFGAVDPTPNKAVIRDATGHVKTADPVEADDAVNLGTAALALYPVGSIYWTGVAPDNGGDPNVLFGGTWVQLKDVFLWAKGDNDVLNATGGAKTVTLTTSSMPLHNHGGTTGTDSPDHSHYNAHSHTASSWVTQILGAYGTGGSGVDNHDGLNVSSISTSAISIATSIGGNQYRGGGINDYTDGASARHAHSITSEGGGAAHENMPPYIVKYCWERTA